MALPPNRFDSDFDTALAPEVNHLAVFTNSPEEIEAAGKYRGSIARSGRFLTFAMRGRTNDAT